ncbi:hypothetical protein [Streptomyces olivoreticuli]|uniref:hypothetical protein n=1 Tax=Streptomyces olivoreticuli TaxID=68246 RepID=UPI000E24C96C|nr:hypothetical protein [Streptomyces olivoreticuli]
MRDDDFMMAVRGLFDDPAALLDALDREGVKALASWGAELFAQHDGLLSFRRLADEPDAGAAARWTPTPGGFRYEVSAAPRPRTLEVSWGEVSVYLADRATPVRYARLCATATAVREHSRAYVPSFAPFRTPEVWSEVFCRPWSRRVSELQLAAACARDAIVPAAIPHPSLF